MTQTSFTHIYQRPTGPIARTVYADSDKVMVAFEGEAPYVLSIHWRAADAAAAIEKMRRAQVDADHAWALTLNRPRFDAVEINGVRTYVRAA
jgi:hypothetical protein